MKKALLMMTALSSALVITACSNVAKPTTETVGKSMKVVTGKALYLQRIALPENAVITVTLSDTSKMDAPAETISQRSFSAKDHSTPFHFSLPYAEKNIIASNTYTVSAKVTVDGKLLFINDTSYPVITHGYPTQNVDVIMKMIPQQ